MCVCVCVSELCLRITCSSAGVETSFEYISIGGSFKTLTPTDKETSTLMKIRNPAGIACIMYCRFMHDSAHRHAIFRCLLFIASPFLMDDKKCITLFIVSFKADSTYMSELTHGLFLAEDDTYEHKAHT